MGRSLRRVAPLAAARGSAVAWAPALFLAGCFTRKTPSQQAAGNARVIASSQGLRVESVRCSLNGEPAWTCTGRLPSGREFSCNVGPNGPEGTIGT
jgi:hypothetical protein